MSYIYEEDIDIRDIRERLSQLLAQVSNKQDVLISGENIKTVNNNNLLGSGNITITGDVSDVQVDGTSVVNPQGVANINALAFLDIFYPVGSYYETSDNTFNPNISWGGTWVQETEGQVHVSAGTNYTVSGALSNISDGGEETHKLTIQEIEPHTHGSKSLTGAFRVYQFSSWDTYTTGIMSQGANGKNNVAPSTGSNNGGATFTVNATHEHNSVGGGQSHNNMQPYINVYRWHRIG